MFHHPLNFKTQNTRMPFSSKADVSLHSFYELFELRLRVLFAVWEHFLKSGEVCLVDIFGYSVFQFGLKLVGY